jgi:holo-[acyl-carrier protein] synthase
MTVRVGVDLVSVAAVEEALKDHGDRYLARVYTEREVKDSARDPSRLAARFAAKEATLKVLRAHEIGIPWPSIEVVRTDWGGVTIALDGVAAARAEEEGLHGFALSLSHEEGFAIAVVMSEEGMPT